MDILIPDMYQKSIYSINYEKLCNCGIRCLLFDLDNNKDIVISDLCFIKFTKNVNLNIYSNYDVLIYERDNLI